jgi:hypothetical protein
MLTIKEGSRQKFRFVFEDENRNVFVPSSVRYRVDDVTDGLTTEVIPWTDVIPSDAMDITIPASSNAILNDTHVYEDRLLSVQSDWGTDSALTRDEPFRIQNLRGFTTT